MDALTTFAQLSDSDLMNALNKLAACERSATATLVACLGEVDSRRLYLALGYTSMFRYCTAILHLSEDATFARIEAARAVRRYPCLLDDLATGALTLTAVRLLAPHLTPANHLSLLQEARHKSAKDVQLIIVRHHPRPPVADTVRRLADPKPVLDMPVAATIDAAPTAPAPISVALTTSSPARRVLVAPLSEQTYKVQFTIRRDVHDKLRRLQDLWRHRLPNGDLAVIFDRGLDLLLSDAMKSRAGAVERPRAPRPANAVSRNIPAHVRRTVWTRDGGACAFRAADGQRCGETGRVEYHHVVPFAAGGRTTIDNLELRCTAHNRYEAEQYFGQELMALFSEPRA